MLSPCRRRRGSLQNLVLAAAQQALQGKSVPVPWCDSTVASVSSEGQAGRRSYYDEAWENSDNLPERPATPWVRTVQRQPATIRVQRQMQSPWRWQHSKQIIFRRSLSWHCTFAGTIGDRIVYFTANSTDVTWGAGVSSGFILALVTVGGCSGIELLRNPKYNKGMAFSKSERDRHYLHGLLPPAYMNQDLQVVRVMSNLRDHTTDLQKYVHLMALQERNERLFYRVLLEHMEELLPIVYTPTVGEVCQQYGLLFRRPRGLFISIRDRGRVMELLKNWPERRVRVIVVTDGERVLGLGDLGVQGMGIPVGKLTLYTAVGGVHPSECLPVSLDVGTNNPALLKHPFYPGLRQNRVVGEEYDDLVDEFMEACKARYGDQVLIQFEDFANHNAFRLLFQYRGSHLVFNDDIQGTAAVALAGLMGALPVTGGKLSDHTYLFNGAGEAGTGIAEMLALQISKEENILVAEARAKIWMVDSKGLVVKSRVNNLQNHKLPFAKDFPVTPDLLDCVKAVRPTALIGVSGKAFSFSKEICEAMLSFSARPIIFPLSNPTSRAECTAEQAYTWTKGKCVFASGSPFAPVQLKGQWYHPGQGNNAYIFPGVGLGCIISGSTRVRDEMFLAAAEALAGEVTSEDRSKGLVYPPLWKLRKVSALLAKVVASKAYELGIATNLPKPPNLLERIEARMWDPAYRHYR